MIKYIIYLFVAVLILSYLGFNVESFMSDDLTQSNLGYVMGMLVDAWETYLKPIYDFIAGIFGPYIDDTLNRLSNQEDFINVYVPQNLVPGLE